MKRPAVDRHDAEIRRRWHRGEHPKDIGAALGGLSDGFVYSRARELCLPSQGNRSARDRRVVIELPPDFSGARQ